MFPLLIISFIKMKSIHLHCLEWDDVKDTARQALASHTFQSISFDICQFTNSVLLCSFISGSSGTLQQLSFTRCELLTHLCESFVGQKPLIKQLILYRQVAEVFDVGLLMSKTFSLIVLNSLQILDIGWSTSIAYRPSWIDILLLSMNWKFLICRKATWVYYFYIQYEYLTTFYLALLFNWTSVLFQLSSLHSLTIILNDYCQNPNTNIYIFVWWINNFQSWGHQGCSLEQVKFCTLSFPFCRWRDLDISLTRVKALHSFKLEVVPLYFQDAAGVLLLKVGIQPQLSGLMLLNIAHV